MNLRPYLEEEMKRRGVNPAGVVLGGSRVQVKGLVGAAHLNGRQGAVGGPGAWDEAGPGR